MNALKAKPTLRARQILCAMLLLAGLLAGALTARTETFVEAWVQHYNGPANGDDYANAVAVDGSGNVFVTGYSIGTGGSYDYATIAYSSAGTSLWTNYYNGPANGSDQAAAVAVDTNGNVFVTGFSTGSGSSRDYATIAYSSAGVPLWTNRYNSPGNGNDQAGAIAVNSSGNVFVTGYSSYTNGLDYLTVAYSNGGVPLWTNRYNGPKNSVDQATAVAVDGDGNVFVTGFSTGNTSSYDYTTIKYSGAGVPLWTNRYDGPANLEDMAYAVGMDTNGNVVVTGSSVGVASYYDYATIKYSNAGVPLWTNRYNGPYNGSDGATAIAVDSSGNVLVTGTSTGTNTFSDNDYATIKYSSTGVALWTNRYNGPGNDYDRGTAVGVDTNGNVFVTGSSRSSDYPYDYATIGYSGAGVPLWTNRYNDSGNGDDQPSSKLCLAIGPDGAVYVTGASDGDDSATTAFDFATVKYDSPSPPQIKIDPISRTNSAGTTTMFAVSATGSAPLRYQWQRSETNLFEGGSISGVNSNTLTLANVQPEDAGNYAVVVTNAFGSVTSSVAVLTVVVPSPITLSSAVISNGVFRFSFSNTPGANFTVLTTTNVGLPLSNWIVLVGLTEVALGQFQFTDPQATNYPQRFYCVRSP